MAVKIKIKLDDLNKDSTPCEICVAMNDREVKEVPWGNYYKKMQGSETPCTKIAMTGGSSCTDVDKARLRIAYIHYHHQK